MPTNLPPEYFEAERYYRAATSVPEKILTLQDLISTIPKHKGTDKIRAALRKRLSKLKASAQQSKKSSGKRDSAYHIQKEGIGQVAIVGTTNVGKSALVRTLTNATPEVIDAPFTTWKPTPGMMPMEDVQIQLIDTPPLNYEYMEPELLNLIRRADFLLLVVDLQTDPIQQLEDTVSLLKEHRIIPYHLRDQYTGIRRASFIPVLVLANKNDDEDADEDFEIFRQLVEGEWPMLNVSAATGYNLERLKRILFEELGVIRVYSKPPWKEPDLNRPFTLEMGSTVEEFARKVHQDFYKNLKTARLWGSGVFDGQMVGRDHILHDGDVVELRM